MSRRECRRLRPTKTPLAVRTVLMPTPPRARGRRWLSAGGLLGAPVSWRKTSSRLARRTVTRASAGRSAGDPGDVGGRAVRGDLPLHPAVGAVHLHDLTADLRASARPGVPSATTRPSSSTTIRSASTSASSRYCVVSSTVLPGGGQGADLVPERLPAAGVEPGGRLVEDQQPGRPDQGHRQVEPATHPAGVGGDPAARGVAELEPLQQLGGPLPGGGEPQPEQPADQDEVLPRRSAARRRRRTDR